MADSVTVTTTLVPDEVALTTTTVTEEVSANVTQVTDSVVLTVNPLIDEVSVAVTTIPDVVTLTTTLVTEQVNVAVTTHVDEVVVEVSNDQGPPGADYNPATSFHGLLFGGVAGDEIAVTSPAVGTRLTYTYSGGVTRYRFYSADDTQDAFYSDAALTALIVSRYF